LKIMTARFLIVALAAATLVVASSGMLARVPAQGAEPVVLAPFTASVAVEPQEKAAAREPEDIVPFWVEPPMVTEWGPGEAEAHERARLTYHGIAIQTSPKAKGRNLAIQKDIAALMTRLDFVPNHRVDHYQWVARYGGKITGWHAWIMDVTQVDEGVVVVIRVYPDNTSPFIVLNDIVLEKYLISDGQLHYLESSVPESDRPKVTVSN
jgi:hypothetical protein